MVPLLIPLPDVFIATNATHFHWDFSIHSSGVPVSCCGTLSSSMWKVHFALQELQGVALMLNKMAFLVCSKVVVLHLDNSTAKGCVCNQGGTTSLFHIRLTCHILNLANKHGIIHYSSIDVYPCQCGS